MNATQVVLYAVTGLSFVVIGLRLLRYRAYLPGPAGLPIFGITFSMPSLADKPWEKFQQWGYIHGDAIFTWAMNRPILILNSYQSCTDLLGSRVNVYSSRPQSIMINRMMELTHAMTHLPYGDIWKEQRNAAALFMRKSVVRGCYPRQEVGAQAFISSLLDEPHNHYKNLRLTAGRALLESMYGIKEKKWINKSLTIAEEAVQMATQAITPGTYFVEFISALQYVPDWFPGTGWKQVAKRARELKHAMVEVSFQDTREYMDRNNNENYTSACMVEHLLQANVPEDVVKWSASVMYGAGIDTTLGFLLAFFRTMSQHPECQRLAQQELDLVVGPNRFPSSDDKTRLPYVNAVVKEVLRWSPPAPLSLPRATTEDDIYRDCFVPQGTIVIPNIWAISRDSKLYPNPYQFNPARFLVSKRLSSDDEHETAQLNPEKYVFGFGRRICAGRNFAENSMFLYVATILSAFTIRLPEDEQGKEIQPPGDITPSAVPLPLPFGYVFVPRRSEESLRALLAVAEA